MSDPEKPKILSEGLVMLWFRRNSQINKLSDLVVGTTCLSEGTPISSPREAWKPIFVLGTDRGDYFSYEEIPFSKKLRSLAWTPWGYIHHLRKHGDFITRAKRGWSGPYAQRRAEMWFHAGTFDPVKIDGKYLLDIQTWKNGWWLVALIDNDNSISYHAYDSDGKISWEDQNEVVTFQEGVETKIETLFWMTKERKFNPPTQNGALYSLHIPGVWTVNYLSWLKWRFVDRNGVEIEFNGQKIKSICEVHENWAIIELHSLWYIFIHYDASVVQTEEAVRNRMIRIFDEK